jgi:hypothetical protein
MVFGDLEKGMQCILWRLFGFLFKQIGQRCGIMELA